MSIFNIINKLLFENKLKDDFKRQDQISDEENKDFESVQEFEKFKNRLHSNLLKDDLNGVIKLVDDYFVLNEDDYYEINNLKNNRRIIFTYFDEEEKSLYLLVDFEKFQVNELDANIQVLDPKVLASFDKLDKSEISNNVNSTPESNYECDWLIDIINNDISELTDCGDYELKEDEIKSIKYKFKTILKENNDMFKGDK